MRHAKPIVPKEPHPNNFCHGPKRSEAALRKIRSKKLDDGTEAHSFQTLLKALSTIVRNICRAPGDNPDAPTFQVVTTPDPKQQRAYDLLETIIL